MSERTNDQSKKRPIYLSSVGCWPSRVRSPFVGQSAAGPVVVVVAAAVVGSCREQDWRPLLLLLVRVFKAAIAPAAAVIAVTTAAAATVRLQFNCSYCLCLSVCSSARLYLAPVKRSCCRSDLIMLISLLDSSVRLLCLRFVFLLVSVSQPTSLLLLQVLL